MFKKWIERKEKHSKGMLKATFNWFEVAGTKKMDNFFLFQSIWKKVIRRAKIKWISELQLGKGVQNIFWIHPTEKILWKFNFESRNIFITYRINVNKISWKYLPKICIKRALKLKFSRNCWLQAFSVNIKAFSMH